MKTEEATEIGMGIFGLIAIIFMVSVIGYYIYYHTILHPEYNMLYHFDLKEALEAEYWE